MLEAKDQGHRLKCSPEKRSSKFFFRRSPKEETENRATGYNLVNIPFTRPVDTEIIANICSFERMEAAINKLQPFKVSGPEGLYPALLQKGWNQLKGYYHVIFQACLRHSNSMCHWHGKKPQVYFSPNAERKPILKQNPSL